jgi:hypothetical protein
MLDKSTFKILSLSKTSYLGTPKHEKQRSRNKIFGELKYEHKRTREI